MDYKEKYEQALENLKRIKTANKDNKELVEFIEYEYPELKESEDEKIRKEIIEIFKSAQRDGICEPIKNEQFEKIFAWLEKQGEQKSADKVEPKFKVKYAGNWYNVFDIKESAGVQFYGIEDEPNHIDYIKAESCEMISGFTIKENGLPYPTKPAVFSEQKSAWSEEDEKEFKWICVKLQEHHMSIEYTERVRKAMSWLKSLKERYTWKPSESDILLLERIVNGKSNPQDFQASLGCLIGQLKKLMEE